MGTLEQEGLFFISVEKRCFGLREDLGEQRKTNQSFCYYDDYQIFKLSVFVDVLSPKG